MLMDNDIIKNLILEYLIEKGGKLGLTADPEEIKKWYSKKNGDIEDVVIKKVLDELVKEKILDVNEDTYVISQPGEDFIKNLNENI